MTATDLKCRELALYILHEELPAGDPRLEPFADFLAGEFRRLADAFLDPELHRRAAAAALDHHARGRP